MTRGKVLITGGAGFIGSHLVDALMNSNVNLCVFDNLSSGNLKNIKKWLGNSNFTFIKGDMLNPNDMLDAVYGCEVVWHLAANPEVKVGVINPDIHFQQNILATFNLLEAIRKDGNVKTLLFASTSTVYGEASKLPTPEDYAPLVPISMYGSSKLSCEILITTYAHIYGFRAIIYRLANIVGPRSRHGVIYDFIQKLKRNPMELEVLGDGKQRKSYLYVSDCIKAMLIGFNKSIGHVEVYNVGSEDQIDVKSIANIVIEEMGLQNVKVKFTGGVDGGKGWIGDVKNMLLDITKLKSLGWMPEHTSAESIRRTTKELLNELPA
ncbi:MAG: NAD-dependent epimerase/dehydratase family protein [Halobacteria archaeon]|nr:GDP-mannose 4,6-dehydratase [Candidatus Bathyarchaeota archaeon]